ncbi:MAG: hypothetical protein HRU07_09960 [Nitrosopumilus sp.]|nr:hypothetical protein [Nitrosopumilus sp.]NRA06452.1 hypothetical protein [Nitrosopumilus sp.]
MAASDKTIEDKQKFKAAIIGVILLYAVGMGGVWGLGAMTGIDPDTLCVEREGKAPICPDGEIGETLISKSQIVMQLYIPLIVFFVGIGVLLYAGIKY